MMKNISCAVLLILIFAFGSAELAKAKQSDDPPASSLESKNNFDAVAHDRILGFSERIDELIDDQLGASGASRNRKATDEVFLRRAYLDIVGRIPTIEETYSFIESRDNQKRSKLIDDLLQSYGYVSRQFNFYADLLRIKTRVRRINGQPYIDYVKDSLEANKPFDQMVRELLTSEGAMLEKGNGATGYFLRDLGMPEDNMSNTVRVFLGTRLECAQCHDHPFDKWTQRQYFEMVAFTGGMKYQKTGSVNRRQLEQAARKSGIEVSQQMRQRLRRLIQSTSTGVSGSGTGLARLPEGFMGADGEEGEIVKAKTIFDDDSSLVEPVIPSAKNKRRKNQRKNKKAKGQNIAGAKPIESRQALADWITADDNPRFAKVIANRLWKQAMGLGLIEPVDVLEDHTVASNPKLMEYLTQLMIELDFDTKQFLRAIYNTKTYQARATQTDILEPTEYAFPGPVMRRMSAEQIWDSMLTMAFSDIDHRQTKPSAGPYNRFGGDIYQTYEKISAMTPKELLELADTISGDDPKAKRKLMMEMGDGDQMRQVASDRRASQKKARNLNDKIRKARRAKDAEAVRELMIERTELLASIAQGRGKMLRASEMPSPAPPGSFLREFGQSDREEIENADSDPAVTQVLSMMNGLLESRIVSNPNTMLMRNVVAADTPAKKIESIFLTILNRSPTRPEIKMWGSDFKDDPRTAEKDLIWTLVNSNEFIFVK